MTSLEFNGLLLFMLLDMALESVIKWRTAPSRGEHFIHAFRSVAYGIGSACIMFMFVSELIHPAWVRQMDAWPIWIFVGVDALIIADLAVKSGRWIARSRTRF